jgi:pilus assembly protein FimV
VAAAPEEDDPLLSMLQEESITGAESDQELLGGETEVNPFIADEKAESANFDFDIEKSEPASIPAPKPAPANEGAGTISQAILDFDLGGDSLAASSSATQHYDESESDIAATIVNPDVASLDSLSAGKAEEQVGTTSLVDFELDVPDVVKPHAAHDDLISDDEMAATSIMSIEPDEDMEFDVQLTESTILGNPGGAGFDLSGISLDLGEKANADAPAATPTAELEALAEELDESTLDDGGAVSDPRRDEVNTKLDLAKAYEEMGDLEGARELLGEVVGEGAPDQVAEAQAILTRLNV